MPDARHTLRVLLCALACALLVLPAGASAQSASSGGASPDDPSLQRPKKAKIGRDGKAIPPPGAPPEVVAAINAGNEIVEKPYRYGGGHASFVDSGYDCSGTVSYALHGAGLLTSPLDSSSFMRWGERGRGRWITVYTNPGHAYVVIAGIRLDTGGRDRVARTRGKPGSGPRWAGKRSSRGYRARHPAGL